MELAKRDKRKFCVIFFCSLIFVIAFPVLALVFLFGKQYAFMIIAAVFFLVSALVSLVAFSKYRDAKNAIEIIRTVKFGQARWRSLQGVACTMGWSEKATRKFIKKCVKLGYVRI